jgi:outer membrane receptor protein involved in Fe transport
VTKIKTTAYRAGAAGFALAVASLAAPAFAQDTAAPAADTPADGQTIVVTGSRIARPELTAQSPVTSVTAESIRLTGATRVEDVLNALPQATVSQTSTVSNGSDGTATANLRNLGDTRTLVLVNGMRLPAGDPSRVAGSTLGSAADLNMIPSFLVKRVEVLTGGASAVYGADAVAGVVNFILDDTLNGFKADFQGSVFQHRNDSSVARAAITSDPRYNNPGNPIALPGGNTVDGGTYTVSMAMGSKLGDNQGHVTVFGSYHHQAPILLSSRDFASCPLASNELESDPGTPSASQEKDFYCTGSSNTARTSLLINGGAGGGLGNPAGTRLIVTPGSGITTYNGATDAYNFNPTNYFQRPDDRWNAGAFIDYEINESFHPYMEFLFMNDKSVAQIAPSGTFNNVFTINCSNPLLSAAQGAALGCIAPGAGSLQTVTAALAKRNVEGGGRQDHLEHTDYRLVAGMKGQIAEGWSYDAHYQYGATIYNEFYLNDFSRSRTQMALNNCQNPDGSAVSDSNCVPYNIFSGTTTLQNTAAQGVTSAAIAYVNTPGFKHATIEENLVNININGDLSRWGIQSPFASKGVALAFGAEYRKESLDFQTDAEFSTGDLLGQGGQTKPSKGSFDVKEGYVEASVPLVSDKPFFQDLNLSAAYRYSSYSTVGSTSTWKIALGWAPFTGASEGLMRFRASINRAVRAPTIQDFFAAKQLGLGGSSDLCAQRSAGRPSNADLAKCLNTAQNDPDFTAHFADGFGIARNPASQYNSLTGGANAFNTTLRPEAAITKTLGVVIEPRNIIRGFSATIDYYDINLKDRIGTDGYTTIFNQCYNTGSSYYCGLIHRDPANGSLWLTPNGYITDPVFNTGRLKTNGIDFSASYTRRVFNGDRINVSFNGTYLLHLKTEVLLHQNDGSLASNGYYDCATFYDDGTACGVPNPHWRHNMRFTYTHADRTTVSLNWRHIGPSNSSASNQDTGTDGGLLIGSGFTPAQIPNSKIKAFDYLDLALRFNPSESFEWRLGVNNIADRNPPIVPGGDYNTGNMNGNTFGGLYDVLGRTLFIGAGVKF